MCCQKTLKFSERQTKNPKARKLKSNTQRNTDQFESVEIFSLIWNSLHPEVPWPGEEALFKKADKTNSKCFIVLDTAFLFHRLHISQMFLWLGNSECTFHGGFSLHFFPHSHGETHLQRTPRVSERSKLKSYLQLFLCPCLTKIYKNFCRED